ncbi:hypothetical protein [Nonomuraea roseola]|uniref:hypothetical protein n=1 Tax=Nonomuraea roseola TaxID=46179 RepID=UPI0031F8AA2E
MWRVRRELVAIKILAAVACAALGGYWYLSGDVRGVILAVPATLLVGAMALRDLLVPVRLATDESGITVAHGYAGSRHVPWGPDRGHQGRRANPLRQAQRDAGD